MILMARSVRIHQNSKIRERRPDLWVGVRPPVVYQEMHEERRE